MPEWYVVVGYLAVVLNVWGNLMLANLKSAGWVVRILTNVTWIVYSIYAKDGLPVMANHLTFFAINVWGWYKWKEARIKGSAVS